MVAPETACGSEPPQGQKLEPPSSEPEPELHLQPQAIKVCFSYKSVMGAPPPQVGPSPASSPAICSKWVCFYGRAMVGECRERAARDLRTPRQVGTGCQPHRSRLAQRMDAVVRTASSL